MYNMGKVGRFGVFGGQYVPETVMNAVHELEEAYAKYGNDPEFLEEYRTLLRDYAGRPSMLYYADRMTKDLGGCKTVIVTAAVYWGFNSTLLLSMTSPLNLPAPGRCQAVYWIFRFGTALCFC